ncbi:Aste57867_8417 [Aphanomyces stellatus]|uniref:Aste57867_8417 protein n=1 Tax=Aphanomyces stellatus TaxID=120398 RepID=A0A485KK77_9STRA|nr:hypothetical protein As57867_008385 [Aphanomyces stellatus]VFT85303.1 Aste57867_8417 [Aphanomyces stellatus]
MTPVAIVIATIVAVTSVNVVMAMEVMITTILIEETLATEGMIIAQTAETMDMGGMTHIRADATVMIVMQDTVAQILGLAVVMSILIVTPVMDAQKQDVTMDMDALTVIMSHPLAAAMMGTTVVVPKEVTIEMNKVIRILPENPENIHMASDTEADRAIDLEIEEANRVLC